MRLTLRTLLAYLDDLLDRREAEDLRKKIEGSELASQLAHRIRNTVGQIRLDSPKLEGQGIGADPNTVSEYLDNTLPPEQVPEFERVCLDSDVHLGEVAACHQILTLVLGETAEVRPPLRRRVYELQTAGRAAVPDQALQEKSTELATSETDTRHHVDVPPENDQKEWQETEKSSYLEKKSSLPTLALVAIVAFLLVFAGIVGLGPLDQNHPLAKILGFAPQVVAESTSDSAKDPLDSDDANRDADGAVTDPTDPPDDISPLFDAKEPDPQFEVPTLDASDADADLGVDSKTIFSEPDTNDELETDDVGSEEFNPIESEVSDDAFRIENDSPLDVPPEPKPLVDPIEERQAFSRETPAQPVPTLPNVGNEKDEFVASDVLDAKEDEQVGELATSVAIPPEQPASAVVVLQSEDEIGLVLNEKTKAWERITPGTELRSGQQIRALPTFRPIMMFSDTLQIELIGMSHVDIENGVSPEKPAMHLQHGRFVLQPKGDNPVGIQLRFGQHRGRVEFGDQQSVAAVEVKHVHRPGTNPKDKPAHLLVRIYATTGSLEWIQEGRDLVQIPAGQFVTFLDGSGPSIAGFEKEPAWISGADGKPIDRIARKGLAQRVKSDRLVSLSLREQATNVRLPEVRSLAVSSLAYLGHFGPLVATLNDRGLRSYWPDQIETLRYVIALNPQLAESLRMTLVSRHEENAEDIYRMLWGYSESQLADVGAKQLVEFLDHERTDFRVVAIETLKQITGKKTTIYSAAEDSQRSRRSTYWRRLLSRDGIKYASRPEIETILEAQ